MAYWESIADKLSSEGWSIAWVRAPDGPHLLWIVDASRDGKKYIVKAEVLTTAFLEIESQTRHSRL